MLTTTKPQALANTAGRAARGLKPAKRGQWHKWAYSQVRDYMHGMPCMVEAYKPEGACVSFRHAGYVPRSASTRERFPRTSAHVAYLPLI